MAKDWMKEEIVDMNHDEEVVLASVRPKAVKRVRSTKLFTDYNQGSDKPVKNELEWLVRAFHNECDHTGYWPNCPQPRCARARRAIRRSDKRRRGSAR